MANTGYLIQPILKKVTDDINQFPLDINNQLCSVSGLPQATVANTIDSPSYKVLNTTACPVGEVTLVGEITEPTPQMGGTNRYGAKFTLSESVWEDLNIDFSITYEDSSSSLSSYSGSLNLVAGDNVVETDGFVVTNGSPAPGLSAEVIINSVTPNPNGGKVIVY